MRAWPCGQTATRSRSAGFNLGILVLNLSPEMGFAISNEATDCPETNRLCLASMEPAVQCSPAQDGFAEGLC